MFLKKQELTTLWLFRYSKMCLQWVIYFCYPNKFLEFVCIELNFWWFWYCKTFFWTSSDIRPKYLLNSCTSWWNFLQILWSKISIQSVLDQMRIRKITNSTVKQWKSKTAVLYTSNLDKSAVLMKRMPQKWMLNPPSAFLAGTRLSSVIHLAHVYIPEMARRV